MPICPLCKQSVLQFKSNSHIIPEWVYKEAQIYDNRGRAIHLDLTNQKKLFFQKGYRGEFICNSCEQKTAELDRYASRIFKDRSICPTGVTKDIKTLYTPSKEIVHIWSGFDFKKIQNFIYSICLRQHCYNLSKGIEELIISKHLSKLLKLYHSDKIIDDESYPIFIIYLDKSKKFIIPPYVDKMSGHHVIKFIACGLEFIIKVSSHPGLFSDNNEDNELKLKSDGSVCMLQMKFQESGTVKKTLNATKRAIHQIESRK